MSVEIRVPSLGESVTEATVAKWFKQIGDAVEADEPMVELETDKVTLEFNAPASGVLAEITVEEGGEVEVGALLGSINDEAAPRRQPRRDGGRRKRGLAGGERRAGAGGAQADRGARPGPGQITPSGPKGNITKGDVLAAIEAAQAGDAKAPAASRAADPERRAEPQARADAGRARPRAGAGADARRRRPAEPRRRARAGSRAAARAAAGARPPHAGRGREERVKMTRLRRRIAERLKEAQNTAAILTTYNEADLSAVMALRQRYRDSFEKKHGVRLGFMSFFVKAAINALQAFPAVNAEIDGDEIVYKHYYDIGVAVGTPSGLVVPVMRNADQLGFAEIEKTINDLGARARDGQARHGGADGRHLHDLQRRRLRLADERADPQPAAGRHPRHAQDPGAAGGGRRRDRDPADDVSGAQLRPPDRRRPRGGELPGAGQGMHRGPGAAAARHLRREGPARRLRRPAHLLAREGE